ncbi:RES family NAD+ phosphorylase [Synechococcus sp. CBW1108]|uniref:RES family NAD+ phosphorylase n=1 Tax=Synechococcus sp. CBW1108 TaxID=1353147 RepID=UPI00351BFFFC
MPYGDRRRPGAASVAIPHGQVSAAFGGVWLRDGLQLGLVLHSVVVPQARNLLLNPLHPAMPQVALVHQEPFRLDQRLA